MDSYGNFSIGGLLTPIKDFGCPRTYQDAGPIVSFPDIPGWYHIWFLKHYLDPKGDTITTFEDTVAGTQENDHDVRPDLSVDQWVFQGVVIPGRKVMLGWWKANPDAGISDGYAGESGPWIMWEAPVDDEWIARSEKITRDTAGSPAGWFK